MLVLLLKLQLQCLTRLSWTRKTLHLCLCIEESHRDLCMIPDIHWWVRMYLQQNRNENGSHYCISYLRDKIKGDGKLPVKRIQSKLVTDSVLVMGKKNWYVSDARRVLSYCMHSYTSNSSLLYLFDKWRNLDIQIIGNLFLPRNVSNSIWTRAVWQEYSKDHRIDLLFHRIENSLESCQVPCSLSQWLVVVIWGIEIIMVLEGLRHIFFMF